MSAVKSRRKLTRRSRPRKHRASTKIRVVQGKVSLRVGGFPGIQKVGASQLVRFVPISKLRAAAKRVLGPLSTHRQIQKRSKKRRQRRRR